MKPITEAELKKQLKGELAPVYLLFGTETYLKQHYVNLLVKKAAGEERNFNFNRFDGLPDMQALYDAASQFPLMRPTKCVLVCDYDPEKASAAELEKLLQIVAEPLDTTVLLFWFDTVEVNLKKATKFKKLAVAAEKRGGYAVELNRRTPAELQRMLCDGASRRGCRMEPTTARYMIENCSDDLQTLLGELEKLCAYGQGEHITREMIDKVTVRRVEVSVYNLAKALTAGRIEEAMSLLDDLFFQRVEPIVILSSLSAPYVDMLRAKAAEAAGQRADAIAADFGYYGTAFRLKNASYAAKRLGMDQLRQSLTVLLEADGRLKGSRTPPRTALEQTLIQLYRIAKGVSS
ncbi:MAG: DNA polymerase III subunit delta [Clostridiales bacterium]|nr:DNA polymerase III subunit delta [Clostridiales bacterium]